MQWSSDHDMRIIHGWLASTRFYSNNLYELVEPISQIVMCLVWRNVGSGRNGVGILISAGIGTVAVTDETVDDCGGHPANGTYAIILVGGELVDIESSIGNHSG